MIIKSAPLGELGANFYMVKDEATNEMFVIDPGANPDLAVSLVEGVGATLKYIILTHAHVDHIGAVDELKEKFTSPIVIHEDDALALNNSQANLCAPFGFTSPKSRPDIIVRDGETLDFGNGTIKIIHTPGHTKGSMCIYLENTLFSGDTLFECSVGRTDFPGGSFNELRCSIQNKLYTLPDDTIVYPGHGNRTTIEFEKNNNPYV